MSKELINSTWKELLDTFHSYEGTISDFCKENNITKSQLYYYRKKSEQSNKPIFHAISLADELTTNQKTSENNAKACGDIRIEFGKANIYIPASEVEVIYSIMKEELLKSNYIQADETTLKVIEDNGKESNSKKYMWLYKTGTSRKPIILYDYQKTRSSSCPKEFLKGFSGYLQTDGYNGYNSVEDIKRLYCLAHIRRTFHDIIINLDEEALKKSRAVIGFNYCEKLYKIEKDIREAYSNDEDYYKNRFELRLEKTAPILDEFQQYVKREIENALPKSSLGQALAYTLKLLPDMKTLLGDGSLEIDNNGSE